MKVALWKSESLSDLADMCLGKMPDQNKNKGTYLPYLANTNVRWGEIELSNLREMKFEPNEFERYGLEPGDIVMCEGGEPGRCAIWKGQTASMMIQKALHRIRAKKSVSSVFLYYALLNMGIQGHYEAYFTGAAIKHLTGENLAKINVLIPTLSIQQKIAAILSAYDDLIENNLKRIKLLEEMAQITYEEWFVRLKFPGHETTPLDSATGLPVGWEKTTCFDLMDVLSGGTPKTDVAEYWNGDIKFFTPKDAANCVYTLETEKTITDLGLKKCNSKLYPKNTIFITARGTVGKLNLAREAMSMNQSCYALIGKNELSQLFLFSALNNAIGAFKGAANGGVFDAIVVDTFRYIPIVKPEENLIGCFDSFVKPIFEGVENLIKQNQLLKETRDILLPRLMTGMIDVEQLPVAQLDIQ